MNSRDLRNISTPEWAIIAGSRMKDFASDRACALIGRPRSSNITGSAVCIEIAGRYFLATAAHVIAPVAPDEELLIIPRGELNHPGVPFVRRSHPRDKKFKYDVAWLEIEAAEWSRSGLRALTLEQTACNLRYHRNEPIFFIQGFPSREIVANSGGSFEPLSLCLASTSVDRGPGANGVAIEYPPQDPADAGLELVPPEGFSGGGIWTWNPLSIWPHINVQAEKLAGLIVAYDPSARHLVSVGMEYWLELVAQDNPELRDHIKSSMRRDIRISPSFSAEKLQSPTLEDLIDVFEDRMIYWLLKPAKFLAPHPHGQVASLNLMLTYFEGVWSYVQGQDSRGNSEIFFTDCFVEVFESCGLSPDVLRRIGEILFEDGRYGFLHDGFFRERIFFGRVPGGCMEYEVPLRGELLDHTGDIRSVTIDVEGFLAYIEGHFRKLLLALRDTSQEDLRSRFHQICREKWGYEK